MSEGAPELRAGSYNVGPPLPAELPKPPFTPGAAGTIAFFFGPFAGALVSAISLRRMRHPEKARKVTSFTLLGAVLLAILLVFTPDALSRIIGLAVEVVFYLTYKKIQENEFAEWRVANADVQPSSGWKAIWWGLVGLVLMLVIFFAVMIVLSLLGIGVR